MCAAPGVRKVVDGYLDEGMTGAGISRSLDSLGLALSSDVINRHKKHYEPAPERPKGTSKRDFAILVRDRAIEQFETGEIDLADKDTVPGINAGLKAQGTIDKREREQKREHQADALLGMLAAFRNAEQPAGLLDDGMTIEGEAVVVER